MILDKSLFLDDAAALTVDRASTNTINFGNLLELGDTALAVHFAFPVAPAAAGAATVAVGIEVSADGGTTFKRLITGPAVGIADIRASGYPMLNVPIGARGLFRLAYDVETGPLTAGKVSAFVSTAREITRFFPRAAH